jgi:transposase InsO family protein
MSAFIDEHRQVYGVEPICKVLPIAPSTHYLHAARCRDPQQRSLRQKTEEHLCARIQRLWIWRQLSREEIAAARCTVERLIKQLGLQGVIRGKEIKTTVPDRVRPCPLDKVHRQFQASRPNARWVADFTYVSTWQGFVYVAFVIDVFA